MNVAVNVGRVIELIAVDAARFDPVTTAPTFIFVVDATPIKTELELVVVAVNVG